MEKKLLLIDSGASFMTNAIVMNLNKEGYSVIEIAATIKEIAAHQDDAVIVLLYLGAYVEDNQDVMVYLKDLCIEKEKAVYVIGDDAEIQMLEKLFPDKFIAESFKRPLDVKKLVTALDNFTAMNSEMSLRKNILLVDDDPVFLQMMRTWLSEKYRVTVVGSGMQAITYLATNTPDLILLDYEMPVTSGPQVLEMIRSEAQTSTTPVIFLTGKDDKESVMSVLALKPDGYLLKTMDKPKILQSIEDFFEREKAERGE